MTPHTREREERREISEEDIGGREGGDWREGGDMILIKTI